MISSGSVSRLRETWNHRLRFGRSGIWFIFQEVIGPLSIILWLNFALPAEGAYAQLPGILGFLVAMNLLMGFGNSYNRAEGALFSDRARLDRLLARPREVVFSVIAFLYLDNLRPTMQSPLLIGLVLAYKWFPGQALLLWGLFFASPLLCAAAGVVAVILVKRLLSGIISGIIFILSALFVLSGLAGAIWLLIKLTQGELPDLTLFKLPLLQPAGWWLLLLLLAGLILVFAAGGLARLWEEALLLQEEHSVIRSHKGQGRRMLAFLSVLHLPPTVETVIWKEWLSLRRSPITKFRMIAWPILSLLPFLHPGLRSLVTSLSAQLIAVFVIWVFCFGELIAAAYQSEADRLGILWLAAVKPAHFAMGKFLAYLPLVLLALGNAGIVLLVSGVRGAPALLVLILAFVGAVTAMAFSLAPAALSMNKVFYHSGSVADMALEQVPLSFPSMAAFFALIGFLAAYCYIIVVNQNSGTAPLAVILAGCGVLAAAAIAVTGPLLKRFYTL
jgi:hypothetical protein